MDVEASTALVVNYLREEDEEEENFQDVSNEFPNENEYADQVAGIMKVSVKVSSFADGSPNQKNKPTKVCPGCSLRKEASIGIITHTRFCIPLNTGYVRVNEDLPNDGD